MPRVQLIVTLGQSNLDDPIRLFSRQVRRKAKEEPADDQLSGLQAPVQRALQHAFVLIRLAKKPTRKHVHLCNNFKLKWFIQSIDGSRCISRMNQTAKTSTFRKMMTSKPA